MDVNPQRNAQSDTDRHAALNEHAGAKRLLSVSGFLRGAGRWDVRRVRRRLRGLLHRWVAVHSVHAHPYGDAHQHGDAHQYGDAHHFGLLPVSDKLHRTDQWLVRSMWGRV